MSHRTATRLTLIVSVPFLLAIALVAGLMAGPVIAALTLWDDARALWDKE